MQSYGKQFTGTYVSDGEDAVLVDYANDVDFAFDYHGDGTLVIRMYVEGNLLVCEIYEN